MAKLWQSAMQIDFMLQIMLCVAYVAIVIADNVDIKTVKAISSVLSIEINSNCQYSALTINHYYKLATNATEEDVGKTMTNASAICSDLIELNICCL